MLQLILLLDGVAVGASLGCVNELITETLSDRLDIPEGSLTSSSAKKPDGLVDPPQRRNIHSLTTDSSSTTDSSGIFPGPRVDDGVHNDLKRILSSKQVNYFEAVLHNPDRHQLLSVVSSVHHQGVHQSLHNGTLRFAEPFSCISSGRMGKILGIFLLNGDVVLERHVRHLDFLAGPFPEQFDLRQLGHYGHRLLEVLEALLGH